MTGNKGVLLTCHGSVERLEDVAAFVRNIRHGRPASPEVVDEVRRRLERIGGSPLMRITREQAAALELRLGIPVAVAGRLWDPYPAVALSALHDAGVESVLSLPLAPQSVHVYHAVVEPIARELGLELLQVPAWGLEPALVEAFAQAILEAYEWLGLIDRGHAAVVLTAHSLPSRVIAAGDPYERDLRAMADAVTARLRALGLGCPCRVAFQSQGMGSAAEWLGPDLPATFGQLYAEGARALVIAPIGFVADHVETLYDIDIEAAAQARQMGFEAFERMPPMNTRPDFIAALEQIARRHL